MKKSFCDICGEPANDGIDRAYSELEIGAPYGWSAAEPERQCRIVAKITFGYVDHSTSFGGPPNLCRACAVDLAAAVVAKLKGGAK